MVYGGAVAFALVALIAVLWGYLDHAIVQPLAAIVKGIETVVHANTDYRIEIDEVHRLGGLPGAVNELIRQLSLARGSVNKAIETATESLEQQKSQLATILQDLHEGVIVCTLNHRIMLYNKRALELLRIGGDIGLDRSLFHFLTPQPILHALTRLSGRLATSGRHARSRLEPDPPIPDRPTVAFVASTSDGRHMLEGRMSLMLDQRKTPAGYVLSFEDDTEELAALGLRDRLLREATEGLRAPVGNLRAAAEILVGTPQLSAERTGRVQARPPAGEPARLRPAGDAGRTVSRRHHRPLADERHLLRQPFPDAGRSAARTARHHRHHRRHSAMAAR